MTKIAQIWIQCCILLCSFQIIKGQALASIRNLEILYEEEGRMVIALRRYVVESAANGDVIDQSVVRYLDDVEERRAGINDVEAWLGHPINALHFLIRLVTDWVELVRKIARASCEETAASLHLLRAWRNLHDTDTYWPIFSDVWWTYKSIIRLWTTYDLDTTEVLNGKIGHSQTDPLSPKEVIAMVTHSPFAHISYNGVIWMQALADRRNKTTLLVDLEIGEEEFDFELAQAYMDYHMPSKVIDIMEKYEDSDDPVINIRYEGLMRKAYRVHMMLRKDKVIPPEKPTNEDNKNYLELCKGDLKSAMEMSTLLCYYKNTRIPYYLVKEEQVHTSPRVTMYHGLITDREMQLLRAKAEDNMTVSTLDAKHWEKNRLSQSSWLDYTKHKLLVRLDRRIELVTGLRIHHTRKRPYIDQYEVVNYGVGGMYINHFDAKKNQDLNPKQMMKKDQVTADMDKLATWMFYLSSVEEGSGGATVFPKLRTRIHVTKGAAVFWYNIDSSGELDQAMLMADCPVLGGSKWTANRWVSYEDNMFSYARIR